MAKKKAPEKVEEEASKKSEDAPVKAVAAVTEELEEDLLGPEAEEVVSDEVDKDLEAIDKDEQTASKKEETPSSAAIDMVAVAAKSTPIVLAKDDIADRLSEQLEDELTKKDFKYLQITIFEDALNEYTLSIRNQSHGFCNYFVAKLLKLKGVLFAAYKLTSLEPPKVFVRTDGSKDIKSVYKEALKQMQIEVKGLANAFASLKI